MKMLINMNTTNIWRWIRSCSAPKFERSSKNMSSDNTVEDHKDNESPYTHVNLWEGANESFKLGFQGTNHLRYSQRSHHAKDLAYEHNYLRNSRNG